VNVINIELPPLRERISDIPLLAEHFLKSVCQESGQDSLRLYRPGHGRTPGQSLAGQRPRLENVIERAVLLGKSDRIDLDDLPNSLSAGGPIPADAARGRNLKDALEGPDSRRNHLDMLESNHWNRHATRPRLWASTAPRSTKK